nr:bromodomain and WD repeat-containing protein 1 isoform X2 [Helicoverpa armigera]
MEESNEEHRVIPELYFLIAKFLSGGPLKETAKTLLKELESIEVLPRRLDWEGREHAQSYDELAAQHADVGWRRLAGVCARALALAQRAPDELPERLAARLSLLSESLVRPRPLYASHKPDHSLVRRLVARELGAGAAARAGGRGGPALFPARMLAGLQLQRRTLGHLSAVYCVVFDCSGRYVMTGADDMLVKVWSAADGRLLATLRGVGAEVTDVCVSADGALLAAGSVDRLVRVWCLASGEPRAVLAAHAGTITSVHWAPPARRDVRWLASTSTDCSVAFWTCSPEGHFLSQPVQYVERMRPGVCHMICAAWSAGGAFLAAGSADHHVRIYTVEHEPGGPKRVLETPVHDDAVDSIAWAHRGLRFVSGSKDGSAALWTLHATQWRHVLLQPKSTTQDGKRLKMTMVCWDCSDAFVLTAASDNTIRVWCARTGAAVRILRAHRDEAYVLEAHPFLAGVFLSAGHDGQLLVWDARAPEPLASFHNRIDGHGDGAIFDAKWGGGASVAATDSHGHLLLLGLGRGHRLFAQLPPELFFHTDYRPVVVDALGGAHDEQTDTPPHLLPPPFLVDVEGAPHAPEYQRLVPGRENLALAQLIPAAEAPRSRIDAMIEALAVAGGRSPRGVWRGEGVRYTAGSWQRGDPRDVPTCTRPLVPPLAPAAYEHIHKACAELNALEQSWYRREMRRRPLMISTAAEGGGGPRRRAGRRRAPARAPERRPRPEEPPEPPSASCSDTSDEWVQRRPRRAREPASSLDLTDTDTSSHNSHNSHNSASKSDSSSSSSQYSDWQAGAELAPPARARRRPLPTNRPSAVTTKRAERAAAGSGTGAEAAAAGDEAGAGAGGAAAAELPDAYRPGEWITAVSPRKAPYHPQMGDECLYFRLGHQRYFEAVAEKDVYKVTARDKPWERTHVYECELVRVVGIKYVIKPPRVACLRLSCALGTGRTLTVRYHDMADVIDFLVLRQQYDAAVARRWGPGDRFRCMIDDCWWTGQVLESAAGAGADTGAAAGLAGEAAQRWAAAAAAQFLSLRVRWDNAEVERLSPWDLEPVDPARLPATPGGAVPVLPHELDAVLYRAEPAEWPPHGDRAAACRAIAQHIGAVMSLAAAEAFVAPVDLQQYPAYARVVPYPVDLATIRARCDNLFYRRAAAAQFDVRYLASNAEQFNEAHSSIVRAARLVSELLLRCIADWRQLDVLATYRALQAQYTSDDDTDTAWRPQAARVLAELLASADAEPFRSPVQAREAPDYWRVVARPLDLGTVRASLMAGEYATAEHFASDVRRVFANSRLYNTNKRSRIYSMTVRLSALWEALWARVSPPAPRRTRRHKRQQINGTATNGVSRSASGSESNSSESETLAATSRRVHARLAADTPPRAARSARSTRSARSARSARTVRAERTRAPRDSWDSDAPLHVHRKGKGVGKKSKSSSASAEPLPSTSREPDEVEGNGASSWSSSSSESHIRVVEEELRDDEVELTYDSDRPAARRKRARPHSDSSAQAPKRNRERYSSSESSSEPESESAGSARHYSSDRSYRPRYSSDEDAPLQQYRARAAGSLRARGLRRYNEDSEEDSVAAISKRLQHHHHARTHHAHVARRRRHHAEQSLAAEGGAHTSDHNYYNGHAHAPRHHPREHHNRNGSAADAAGPGPAPGVSGTAGVSGTSGTAGEAGAVSISSRGRVRKLTAKARGLLRE